jgi:hypothetical protein
MFVYRVEDRNSTSPFAMVLADGVALVRGPGDDWGFANIEAEDHDG